MEVFKYRMIRITPDNITILKANEVLVYGSNPLNNYSSSTAKLAYEKFGGKVEVGLGLQGQSYAIPAMQGNLQSLETYVKTFILFVKNNQKMRFYVTPIGCDTAGYSPEQIAPYFKDVIDCENVFLPLSFWKVIEKQNRLNKYRENIHEITQRVIVSEDTIGVRTSNYPYFSIDVQIQEYNLVVTSGIANEHISLCTILKDKTNSIINKDYINSKCQYLKKIPNLLNKSYILDLYFQRDVNGLYYRQLSLPIKGINGKVLLDKPIWGEQNTDFFNSIPNNTHFLKEHTTLTAVVPGALTEFRNLANKLTKYDSNEYNKLLSIHDWLAKNIFYDYDSLNNGNYKNIPLEKTAITTLRTKRCVCQGYTDLSVALLRSIGIPSMGIHCWVAGENDDENAFKKNLCNHIFTAAYINDRWILCDITWDSKNRYENDSYNTDKKISHAYFDATVQFMSYTHKFINYQ